MKVMRSGIAIAVPGKMAEFMELNEKYFAIARRLGAPPMKCYRPLFGGGDVMHSLVCQSTWDSAAAMEAFFDQVMADPEAQALIPKWDAVCQIHELQLYVPVAYGV